MSVSSYTQRIFAFLIAAALASCGDSSPVQNRASVPTQAALPPKAECVLNSPRLQVGASPELTLSGVTYTRTHQPDAPSALELPLRNAGPQPAGPCKGNARYRFGSGLYDTTGPIGGNVAGHADMAGNVLPPQPINGIHTRLYARAFTIESACNGKRVAFVSIDLAFPSLLLRQEVLKGIAADNVLSAHYSGDNLMISGTHTHSAGSGFGDPAVVPTLPAPIESLLGDAATYLTAAALSSGKFDHDNFSAVTGGIVQALRRAHANLQAHPESAPVTLAIGQLLNANRSRDPPAYRQNAPSERARYRDLNGNEVDVDKRFLQLNFMRGNGSAVGVINWFGVHPTVMSNHNLLISSDNKGYASLGFERLMGTRYMPDSAAAPSGADNFVAAFAQTDEGNSVPDLFVFDADVNGGNGPGEGVPYRYRHGTEDAYDYDQPGYKLGMQEATAVSGTKQLAQALKQFGQGSALSGPVDYRLMHVDMSNVTVTDPVIRAGIGYPDLPESLYADPKNTCAGSIGLSKLAGGVNAPVFGSAGFACIATAPAPYLDDVRNGYNGLFNGTNAITINRTDLPVQVPFNGTLAFTALTPVLCETMTSQAQYSCQPEKPVLIGGGSAPAPFQIFRIGNLAILGLPWEITTMAARRLRQTVLDALSPVGVDTVVIAGLTNDYLDYLTTREEFTAQMYEGASTSYGPWQLAATQQESRRLALALAAGEPAPAGVPPATASVGAASPVITDPPGEFGTVLSDAAENYTQGQTVDVSFVAGFPGNDLKPMSSYLFTERQNAAGGWDVVAADRDAELVFVWNANPSALQIVQNQAGASSAQSLWKIPLDASPGTYRIRYSGVHRLAADEPAQTHEGVSRTFQISGVPGRCP